MSAPTLPPIRFRFRPQKALAAIHQMLVWADEDRRGPLDLHTALKACYFADKEHLNRHWRPIFGATYRAMAYGPVPLEIYELLKGEPLWLAELGLDDVPWERKGYCFELRGNEPPPLDELSPSDREALKAAFTKARGLTFNARTAASHDQAWERARLGLMRYEDMIAEDNPDREAILDALYEDAHLMDV